jgi:hypothetical protein
MAQATVGAGNLYVEDGTGYENSDTYVSIDFADAHLLLYAKSSVWHTADILDKASALRRATFEWAEGMFQSRWRGTVDDIFAPSQRLAWPRIGAYDDSGRIVDNNVIPTPLKEAVALVANDILANSLDVLPSSTPNSGSLIRETKKGAGFEKTQEWSDGGNSSGMDVSLVRFRAAEALVYPLLEGSNGRVRLS